MEKSAIETPLIDGLYCEYLENPLGLIEPHPRFSWRFSFKENTGQKKEEQIGENAKSKGFIQSHYRILVASNPDLLEIKGNPFEDGESSADYWDSGIVASSENINIEYKGKAFDAHRYYYWKVYVLMDDNILESDTAFFSEGPCNLVASGGDSDKTVSPGIKTSSWPAEWIGIESTPKNKVKITDLASGKETEIIESNPSHYLRKVIDLKALSGKGIDNIKSAFIYSTALGEYRLFLDGKPIPDGDTAFFAPEWTNYNKRILYQTYDLKRYLDNKKSVGNGKGDDKFTIGVILNDGWALGLLGPGDRVRQLYYSKERRFSALIHITFDDNSELVIPTDGSWKVTDEGPIRKGDHFLGEYYDSRMELGSWWDSDYSDTNWQDAFCDSSIKEKNFILAPQMHEPIRIYERLKPKSIRPGNDGEYIIDMGQNMVGFIELTLRKPNTENGNKIIIRHGEMLNEDGSLHRDNLRLALQEDIFIANGSEVQHYHPIATFHGFQYVSIRGLKEAPKIEDITGLALASSSPRVSSIETSSQLVNRLLSNILWTQRNNMVSIPTDCPQRNERMGWMGDINAFAQTAIYNLNMAAFLTNFIHTVIESQAPDGRYPDFAPHPMDFDHSMNSPGWADAGIILPWLLYLNYRDLRIIEKAYPSMIKYIEYMMEYYRANDYVYRNNNYGDWLNGNTVKSKGYPKTGAALRKPAFALIMTMHSIDLLTKIAKILEKNGDIGRLSEYYNELHAVFDKKYIKRGIFNRNKLRKVANGTQSAYALTLHYNLLPKNLENDAFELMVKNLVNKYDKRISTGFLSTSPLMIQLTRRGREDLAYYLLLSTRLPSWGYSIKQGATTIWERWDAYVKGRGFQSKGMNSFDHYAFGAVGEWIHSEIIGIRPMEDAPGYTTILLAPRFYKMEDLNEINATYNIPNGTLEIGWKSLKSNDFLYEIAISPNIRAVLSIKCKNAEIKEATGKIERKEPGDGTFRYELSPGRYSFIFSI